ncbi:cysteine/histidine-rich C1 domain-containing protein [Anopheles sinensis]|uniref:Cysteine/histidine-rich C1 domain-containing protein n=1 Tax=Anopheles sinensis TaxID=74873 RepID=A0A084VSX8_ANOSI|nr:cysteine/histidine-rich C1 domain-containing protein [Anopheles sinensis]
MIIITARDDDDGIEPFSHDHGDRRSGTEAGKEGLPSGGYRGHGRTGIANEPIKLHAETVAINLSPSKAYFGSPARKSLSHARVGGFPFLATCSLAEGFLYASPGSVSSPFVRSLHLLQTIAGLEQAFGTVQCGHTMTDGGGVSEQIVKGKL